MGEVEQTTTLSSLEAPTMVNAGGTSPVMAIIEHLSANECRMRSVNSFAIGLAIDFSVAVHGAPTLPLQGKIVACTQNGARFAYVVALQSTTAQAEGIAKVLAAAQARKAAHVPDVPAVDGLTRGSVRVPVDFELRYARNNADKRSARATNISTGGIHMNTQDEIPVGGTIELEIPLGMERVKVHGRIVAHQELSPNYNIAFFDINNEVRESLARFVQAKLQN